MGPRCPEAVGLTAQEPACQEFGASGHEMGAAEGSPGSLCPATPERACPVHPEGQERRRWSVVVVQGRPLVPTGPPKELRLHVRGFNKMVSFSPVRHGTAWGPLERGVVLGLAPAVNSYYADQRSCVRLITELKNEGKCKRLCPR